MMTIKWEGDIYWVITLLGIVLGALNTFLPFILTIASWDKY